MGFGNLFKAVVKTVTLPIEVVKDVATLGMRKATEGETFTGKRIEDIADELDSIKE